MTTTLFVLIFTAVAVAFWSAGRAAAEVASIHGRHACTAAGVQWLDQTVHLLSIRLRRNGEGRLAWERQFQFEYSTGGDDRHAGRLIMQGTRLIATFGPVPSNFMPSNILPTDAMPSNILPTDVMPIGGPAAAASRVEPPTI